MTSACCGQSIAMLTALLPSISAAQSRPDSVARELTPVRVTVTRDVARSALDLPYSLSRLVLDSARVGARRGSLTDLLITVPGLVVSNRHNPTQDPRVAVRGFGARAAFGIRGLRVVRDGVPLTIADGQAAIDFVDLETVGAAEVMRGAAGALYGNASGGVVALRTESYPEAGVRGRLRTTYNQDATRYSGTAAGAGSAWAWQGTVTRNTADGPRDYARFRSTSGLGDIQRRFGGTTLRAQLTWYDTPLGENPGAVTATELIRAPEVADSQNIRRRASKTVTQKLLALIGDHSWSRGNASASLFGGLRDLYNPQAFAIVGFDRRTLGLTMRVQQSGILGQNLWRVAVGADLQSQRDDRSNFVNCAGLTGTQRPVSRCPTAADRGVETIHQLEEVAAAGMFVRGEVTRSVLSVTGTIRGDNTDFTVRDRLTTAPSGNSQSRDMGAITPMLGVTVKARPQLSIYANVAGSFETPTTTELANQPNGQGGLNGELNPQRGRTLELGAKGLLGGRVLYDVSVFDIATTDELIPFEIPNSGGRRFFRNAGETSRRGAELGISASLGGVLDVGASLARLVYEYEQFTVATTVLDGKRVPGVSPTTGAFFATVRPSGGFVTIEAQHGARAPADDANVNYAPGWVVWNARAGLTGGWTRGIEPVIGIENLFDRTYVANVVANATRGRFFEPGARRRVYVALSVRGQR
ncbi:MAG: TonB-dependent receptor family protein [Gemmatimonadaceae bacterium]